MYLTSKRYGPLSGKPFQQRLVDLTSLSLQILDLLYLFLTKSFRAMVVLYTSIKTSIQEKLSWVANVSIVLKISWH